MRIGVAVAFLLAGASAALAQGPDQETLKANYEKKLKAPFLLKAEWITDWDKARETAKKAGKPIFGYFSRSYSQ